MIHSNIPIHNDILLSDPTSPDSVTSLSDDKANIAHVCFGIFCDELYQLQRKLHCQFMCLFVCIVFISLSGFKYVGLHFWIAWHSIA